MSDMELRVGRLTPIPMPADISFQEQIDILDNKGYRFEDIDLAAGWFYSEEVTCVDGVFYEVNDKEYEESGDVDGTLNDDGTIDFLCFWYNGGAGFDEVLESAINIAHKKKN